MAILKIAVETKVLAANQDLYSGFIAAGLSCGLFQGGEGVDFKIFFLTCVVVAGLCGGLTANRKLIFIQGLPGLIGLLLVTFASYAA